MNKTIQIDKSRRNYKQSENASIIAEERLPPIRQSFEPPRRNSHHSTIPVRSSRYGGSSGGRTPTRDQNPIDFQVTKYFHKRANKSISGSRQQVDSPRESFYYADSRLKLKGSSFHWNIGTPRNIQVGNSTVQVNEDNPHKDIYRNKNF